MATVSASYSADGETLQLKANGLEPLIVPTKQEEAPSRREVNLFSGQAKVVDIAAAGASEWFRHFSGVEGCSLVKSDADATALGEDWRQSRREFQSSAFAGEDNARRPIPLDDGGTILLVSQASLEELNRRLAGSGMPAIKMSRFRPNLVVDGIPAHAEDEWLEVQVGECVRLKVERPCTRCSTVLVDQESGTSDKVNWLSKVLARYRLSKPDPAYGTFDLQGTKFGVYCTPLTAGSVREGDEVKVLRCKG